MRKYLLITSILKGDCKPVENADLFNLSFLFFILTSARWISFESNVRQYFTTSDDLTTSDNILQCHNIDILVSMTHTFDSISFLIVNSPNTPYREFSQHPRPRPNGARRCRYHPDRNSTRQWRNVATPDPYIPAKLTPSRLPGSLGLPFAMYPCRCERCRPPSERE